MAARRRWTQYLTALLGPLWVLEAGASPDGTAPPGSAEHVRAFELKLDAPPG